VKANLGGNLLDSDVWGQEEFIRNCIQYPYDGRLIG
jgi:hypothetical protein